jgi:PEP-CTERM motif
MMMSGPRARANTVACIVIGLSVAALGAPSAQAKVFDFSYEGLDQFDGNLPFSASGQFVTTNTLVDGAYTITSISGERDGVTISNLDPPNYVGMNDNLFFPAGPYFDFQGVAYNANHLDYNLYYDSSVGAYEESTAEGGFTIGNVVTLSITPVPEPSTFLLVGAGIAGLALARWRGWARSA